MSAKAIGGRLHTGKPSHAPAPEAFHAPAYPAARLHHACQAGYAFGFALLRRVLGAIADRLHACPPLGIESGG
jgi:hypothetical protein